MANYKIIISKTIRILVEIIIVIGFLILNNTLSKHPQYIGNLSYERFAALAFPLLLIGGIIMYRGYGTISNAIIFGFIFYRACLPYWRSDLYWREVRESSSLTIAWFAFYLLFGIGYGYMLKRNQKNNSKSQNAETVE